MDNHIKQAPVQGISGLGGGPSGALMSGVSGNTFVDQVYAQNIFTGNDTDNRDIVNGIDLSGEGGAIWQFVRNVSGRDNTTYDTVRGVFKQLNLQSQGAETDLSGNNGGVKQFNSNGFRLESGARNNSGEDYVAYTFRKAAGFFDIVTYTGNNSNRTISHNLGSTPGVIIIKKRNSGSTPWTMFHRSLGATKYMKLNSTDAVNIDDNTIWNDTAPTDSVFTVGTHTNVNANSDTYVAYLFAHDAQSFGINGDASIIKCDTYTGNGSNGANANDINVGFEPQWILISNVSRTYENWVMHDSARTTPGTNINSPYLKADSASTEVTNSDQLMVTPRGFSLTHGSSYLDNEWNKNGDTYIYMAIRIPDGIVGKPIETGTDAFTMDTGNGSSDGPCFDSDFAVDFALRKQTNGNADWWAVSRLANKEYLVTNTTAAKLSHNDNPMDYTDGWGAGSLGTNLQSWMWKRHAGFDVVIQKTTTESGTPTYEHNLGVVPEMIWSKRRDAISDWTVYHKGLNGGTAPYNWRVRINESVSQYEDTGLWGSSGPTDTQFYAKGASFAIGSHIFLLFASVTGVSKVGSYTGSSSAITVTTGFQPRFVIIKNITDNGYGWVVLDTTRGWGSGNDEYLELNSLYAQAGNLDRGAPTSTGFTIPAADIAGVNRGSSKKYIYYAHA